MRKRIAAALLAAVMLLTGISATAFTDITDEKTAENAAVLQTLGAIDGFEDGSFRPNDTYTRAQFCKMAVVLMQPGTALGQAANITVFPDVRSSHWAAKYINYATKTAKIIAGYGDGTFKPDNAISFAEAVTILMRVLGYTDADVGAIWPDGYLEFGELCGLTNGLADDGKFTRAEAAALFVNFLNTRLKDSSTTYLDSISSQTIENAVILSCNGNTLTALTDEERVYASAGTIPDSMIGKRVTLALDAKGIVIAAIPATDVSIESITVSSATATTITTSEGKKILVPASVKTVVHGEYVSYGMAWMDIAKGDQAMACYDKQGILEMLCVFSSDDAMVLDAEPKKGENPFVELFGLPAGSYSIVKNGEQVDASALRLWDVAVYDKTSKTFVVSDAKLTGYYEDATPNYANPEKVYLLGKWFEVADCAATTVSAFRASKTTEVTALFTPSGKVAAFVYPSVVRAKMVGVVNGDEVGLTNGLVISGESSSADYYNGKLVTVTVPSAGKLSFCSVNLISETDIDKSTIPASAVVYDSAMGCGLRKISVADIHGTAKAVYLANSDFGKLGIVVLNNATGDCYEYGKVTFLEDGYSIDFDETTIYQDAVRVNGGEIHPTTLTFTDGEYYGIAVTNNGYVTQAVKLVSVNGISRSAFAKQGYVKIDGKYVKVSDNASVYITALDKYVTLAEARSYSNNFTVYLDATIADGGVVRVIIAK